MSTNSANSANTSTNTSANRSNNNNLKLPNNNNSAELNNNARTKSAANREKNDGIIEGFKATYKQLLTDDQAFTSTYKTDLKASNDFITSMVIDLKASNNFIKDINKKTNNGEKVLTSIKEQYATLVNFNKSSVLIITNNTESKKKVAASFQSIATLMKTISKAPVSTNNGKDELTLVSKKITNVQKDIGNIYQVYSKLEKKFSSDYTTQFNMLKTQIKETLIAYYTKLINQQIANNKFNKNFTDVQEATTDKAKVAILTTIKGKLDVLDNLFNTYVSSIIENINTNQENASLKAYRQEIQSQINDLSEKLNASINSIRTLTQTDIKELQDTIPNLVGQIRALITKFSPHNYYNTTDYLAKLNTLDISSQLNNSGKSLGTNLNSITRQLAAIAGKIDNQQPATELIPTNAQQVNAQQVNAPALTGNAQREVTVVPMTLTANAAPFQGASAPANFLNQSEKENLNKNQSLKTGDIVTWASGKSFLKGSVNNIKNKNGVKQITVTQSAIMPRQGKQQDLVWKNNSSAGTLNITPDKLVNEKGKKISQNQLNKLMGTSSMNFNQVSE